MNRSRFEKSMLAGYWLGMPAIAALWLSNGADPTKHWTTIFLLGTFVGLGIFAVWTAVAKLRTLT